MNKDKNLPKGHEYHTAICRSKTKFMSKAVAWKVIDKSESEYNGVGPKGVYKCPICRKFHLTSQVSENTQRR